MGRRKQRIGLRRLLGLAAFLPIASRAPMYGRLFWELVRDERTPAGRKALLAGALGYLVLGRDLVPDDLPVIGGLDDLVVVVLAVDVFLDGVPMDVLDEKLDALGIDRRAFRDDVARIRRFTPGSLRRIIRRAPDMVTLAGDTLHNSRLGPKFRAWINN
ncbi:MAG TPA: YkvA family protein [Candidatus Limnocylindrales bacterium]|nr:YkvA family protein [Candidatus Limnocylindrales bacterium]